MNESPNNRLELSDDVFDILNQPSSATERLPERRHFELPQQAEQVADALSWVLRSPHDSYDSSTEFVDATVLFERATVAWAKFSSETRTFEPLRVHREAARAHFLIGSPEIDDIEQDCTVFFHPGAPKVTWEVNADLCRFDISFHGFHVNPYVEGQPFDDAVDPEARLLLSISVPCPTTVSSER